MGFTAVVSDDKLIPPYFDIKFDIKSAQVSTRIYLS